MKNIFKLKFKSPYALKKAFTLSEVLITLVVIGVVAAITVPMLNMSAAQRANSQRQANIVAKITHATDLMRANNALNKFSSTDEFADELQKYLKISKRCDSDHIAECWPTDKVTTRDGSEYEVAKAKTRADLGFDDDNKDNKNVGIILADGAHIILTYNPASPGLTTAQESKWHSKSLPVGSGENEDFEYTSNTTAGLAFVMDVNGGKGPNKESVNTKYYDIRSFNTAHFTESGPSCNQYTINGTNYCIVDSWDAIDCTTITDDNRNYCTGKSDSGSNYETCGVCYSTDYWAGAKKACSERKAELPTKDDLVLICNHNKSNSYNDFGISSGGFWSSTLWSGGPSYAWLVNFNNCNTITYGSSYPRGNSSYQVLCVGN